MLPSCRYTIQFMIHFEGGAHIAPQVSKARPGATGNESNYGRCQMPSISTRGEMESCTFKGCRNVVPARQNCWECGKAYCEEHRNLHVRCQKFIVCEKCLRTHERWCEKNLPYLGPLKIEKIIGSGPESVYLWHYKAQS